jgi:hypothetical protein
MLALVTLREAVDLFGVFGLTIFGAFCWSRRRRRDALERAARKERQAEFTRRMIRGDRERAEALRCRGGVIR